MSSDPPFEARVHEALSRWFAAEEAGEPADLGALCGGDLELAARVRRLIDTDAAVTASLTALPPRDPGEPLPAERLGDFRLLSLLGAGGMGRVYLAEQQSLHRMVALKVLDRRTLAGPARLRFHREAELAGQLDHPHIVPVYGLGDDGGFLYLAMKWLSGPSLDALEAPLAPRDAARLGALVARALHEAHLCGVIHRDIKPANIILDDGRPYVADFGLARGATDVTLTQEGTVPGTLAYLAPELLRQGAPPADPRTDVYSLGATLYEIVAGRPPFAAAEAAALIPSILLTEAPTLGLAGQDRDLETIVLRALDKDPARRFPSALAMAEDLERYERGEPIRSRPITVVTRLWRLADRHRRPAATIAILTLLAVAAVGALIVRASADEARFGNQAAVAGEAIALRQFRRATDLVRDLGAERADDARVAALRRRLAGASALDELLDLALDRGMTVNQTRLAVLIEQVTTNGGARENPRNAALAMALVAIHRGQTDQALARVREAENFPPPHGGVGRDTAAIGAAARQDRAVVLPAARQPSADEHTFAATGLWLLGRPASECRDEIHRAADLDPASDRVHFVIAVLDRDDERVDAAEDAFLNSLRPELRQTAARRNLARLCLLRGDAERAARFLAGIDGGDRDPLTVLLEAETERRRGRADRARALVAEAERAWPADPDVLIHSGLAAIADGRVTDGAAALERVTREAWLPHHRELAAVALLDVRLWQITGTSDYTALPVLDAAQRSRVAEARVAAADLAQRSRNSQVRSRSLLVSAWCKALEGDPDDAVLADYRAAINVDPTGPIARVRFVNYVLNRFLGESVSVGGASRDDLWREAGTAARYLVEHEGAGVVAALTDEIDDACYARAVFAAVLHDDPAYRAAAAEAIERLRRHHPHDPRINLLGARMPGAESR